MTAPPFAYYGGKTRMASKIAALLPAHEHYIEPFAGSLAVLLTKEASRMEPRGGVMTDALFDLPDGYMPAPEHRSVSERRKALVAARIARGEHPLGNLRILPGAHGHTCGDCEHRQGVGHHDKTYPKCCFPMTVGGKTTYPRVSHSDATDCRAWWPACTDYQPREENQP